MATEQSHANYKTVTTKDDLDEFLSLSMESDFFLKHASYIKDLKGKHATSNIISAVIALVLGVAASIYGIFDVFGGYRLPMGILFLIGGPIMIIFAIIIISKASSSKQSVSTNMTDIIAYETAKYSDLKDSCNLFYSYVFGKDWTDATSKKDHLMEVAEIIPYSVLKRYEQSWSESHKGWQVMESDKPPRSGEKKPVKCSTCNKETPHSKESSEHIPVNDKYGREIRDNDFLESSNIFVICEYCGGALCYRCYISVKYLCPICRKAGNGWDGLEERWAMARWDNLKNAGFSETKDDLPLIDFKEKQGDNAEIVNVQTTFAIGHHAVTFRNIAVKVDKRWFLMSAEPGDLI